MLIGSDHNAPPARAAMTTPPTTTDVDRTRVPISSMPRTNLSISVMNLWQQSKAKVDRLLRNPPPVVSRTHEITCPLPHEIAEMIIAHLIHDLRALKAYSLTCRSWYIVAVPHIHRTLVLGRSFPHDGLEPLSRLHRLGLIPLVQEIRVERLRGVDNWFVPQAFGRSRLRHFSTFANVHTLGLQRVEIFHFFPHVERYFGQFSPTLRSIVLSDLRCTPRQLSHFLSLFPNLDDIKICGLFTYVPNTTVPDTTPIPFSTPELRGCLSLGWFSYVETWTHLITSCGGLRFHRMELWESARCVSALLEACAETLEILRFHATDRSRRLHPVAFPGYNLSQLAALRSLQVVDWVPQQDLNNTIVMEAFSTITSHEFSELVVVLSGIVIAPLPHQDMFFRTLRKMNEVRPFKLVFSFEGPCFVQRGERWELTEAGCQLKEALDCVDSKGFLDFLDAPPTIRIVPRSHFYDWNFSDFD